jgi:hypothetical protein
MKTSDPNKLFDEWFCKQFGYRPVSAEDELQYRACLRKAHIAQTRLNELDEWLKRRDAALKGWCAK